LIKNEVDLVVACKSPNSNHKILFLSISDKKSKARFIKLLEIDILERYVFGVLLHDLSLTVIKSLWYDYGILALTLLRFEAHCSDFAIY